MSLRRFFAKPVEAFAHVRPAAAPKASETSAMSASTPPVERIWLRLAPDLMASMRSAV